MIRVKRLLKSFEYSFKGLSKTLREEQNLQIQSVAAIFVLFLAFVLDVEHIELAILVIMILVVILMEVLNSAVERITDVLKPRINTYVKDIKDIMAAAVMLSAMAAIVVGVIIFYPYLS